MLGLPASASSLPRLNPLWPAILVFAVLAAYANCFEGAFVFDDKTAVLENRTIHSLSEALAPPKSGGSTVSGRPLVNLSLALNYAQGGTDVKGYHAFNLGVHLTAALLLFGILRRSFHRVWPAGSSADWLAAVAALLWAVHPLTTGAVTYISQRAEALAGMFMLLALYALHRGATGRSAWFGLSVSASAAAMACKETAVVLPLLAVLYDRTFLAGSWRAVWRRRWTAHIAIACTWCVLAWLVLLSGGRDRSAGFDSGVVPFHYALTQAKAVALYLRLAVWPEPLVFDYGRSLVTHLREVWFTLLVVFSLVAATLWALVRRPVLGFVGAWFFLTLAPSSSVVPVATQTIAEHRMYLALAAACVLAASALRRLPVRLAGVVAAVVAVALGATTFARNRDYRSEIALWTDTVRKLPANSRAQLNLGVALAEAGRLPDAAPHLAEAARLAPGDADARNNLANVLQAVGRTAEALPHYAEAARLAPGDPRIRQNYGRTLAALERHAEAVVEFEAATRAHPEQASAFVDLAHSCMALRRTNEAETAFRRAVALAPGDTEIRFALGNLFVEAGRPIEAAEQFHDVLQLDARHVRALNNLGNLYLLSRRPAEAAGYYQRALAVQPDAAQTHSNLGTALVLLGEMHTGEQHLRRALELDPTYAPARTTLDRVLRTRRSQP
jgi:protein O-mannosyl-transferase